MKILQKLGKIVLSVILLFVGLFVIIFVSGTFVIILSKIFTNLWGLDDPGDVLLALFLAAIIFGLIYKPTRWIANKWASFINTI